MVTNQPWDSLVRKEGLLATVLKLRETNSPLTIDSAAHTQAKTRVKTQDCESESQQSQDRAEQDIWVDELEGVAWCACDSVMGTE
ncbi:hypothetical protein E4U43_002836 [Claviceps pusilla]|uniref:Uncharacterized protein n=1 Tax=Claviceps pusilla TaxID=123648 RepID=A0A9P7SY23_9HYPO|nr:hypothetical protein E4U43_002836 [Claviceps pusilla]